MSISESIRISLRAMHNTYSPPSRERPRERTTARQVLQRDWFVVGLTLGDDSVYTLRAESTVDMYCCPAHPFAHS